LVLFLSSHGDILYVGVVNGVILQDMASPKPSTSADSVVVVEDPVDVELAKQSGRIQRKKEAGSTMKMELLPIEVSGKIQMRV